MQDWYRDGYPRSIPQHGYRVHDWPTDRITLGDPETEKIILPDPPELETVEVEHKLHPMQWITYIVVVVTCLAVLYGFLELVLFVNNLSNVLEEFSNRLGEGI